MSYCGISHAVLQWKCDFFIWAWSQHSSAVVVCDYVGSLQVLTSSKCTAMAVPHSVIIVDLCCMDSFIKDWNVQVWQNNGIHGVFIMRDVEWVGTAEGIYCPSVLISLGLWYHMNLQSPAKNELQACVDLLLLRAVKSGDTVTGYHWYPEEQLFLLLHIRVTGEPDPHTVSLCS